MKSDSIIHGAQINNGQRGNANQPCQSCISTFAHQTSKVARSLAEGIEEIKLDVASAACQLGGCSASRELNTKSELDADVDIAGHFDDFGELNGFFGCGLEVVDGEDLEA